MARTGSAHARIANGRFRTATIAATLMTAAMTTSGKSPPRGSSAKAATNAVIMAIPHSM